MSGFAAATHLAPSARGAASATPRVLVLGYGNPGRQDDGLGPAAVAEIEKLAWPGVTAYDNYQLAIEDVVEIAECDVVWFVDAARSGPEPYQVVRLTPAFDIAFTSHLVRPELLLALADRYYGNLPESYLVGIRGYEFEFAEGLTERASRNLAQALHFIRSRVAAFLERYDEHRSR